MANYHIIENPLADFDTTLDDDSGIESTNRSTHEPFEGDIERDIEGDIERDIEGDIEGSKERTAREGATDKSSKEGSPSLKKLLDETPLTTNLNKTKSPKQLNQSEVSNVRNKNAEQEKDEEEKEQEGTDSPDHSPVKVSDKGTPTSTERKDTAAGLIALANVMHSDSEDDDYTPGRAENKDDEEEDDVPIARQYKLRDVTKGTIVDEAKTVKHTDDDKKKANDLWTSFKADVSRPITRRAKPVSADQCNEVTYDFAGESVTVQEDGKKGSAKNKRKSFMDTLGISDMDRKRRRESAPVAPTLPNYSESEDSLSSSASGPTAKNSGPAAKKPVSKLSSLVNRLAKKPKMSILNKTSLDWDKYKADKGIADEVKNEAKGGYLEKQDFLSRTDERQYELEKEIRLQIQRRRQMMNSKQF